MRNIHISLGVFTFLFYGCIFGSGQLLMAQTKPAAKPYHLPFQLRPAAPVSVVRVDSTVAMSKNSTTFAYFVLGSYKAWKNLAPFVRLGIVDDTLKTNGKETTALVNPALGAAYTFMLPQDFRITTMVASTLPVGMGGGNEPDTDVARTVKVGNWARAAMDGAMYAVNDWTAIAGVDAAWVKYGLSIQAETTFLFLTRVCGEKVQKDTFKANLTSGLSVGYFITSWCSASTELRYQRWLSTPVAVEQDKTLRDTLSIAAGVRFHLQLTDKIWLRPGIAYARGLTGYMNKNDYNLLFVDLPVAF